MRLLTRIVLAAFLLAAAHLEVGGAAAPDPKAVFGIFAVGADGKPQFVETAVVPSVDGQSYGWVAAVEPSKDAQPWSEEITLPKAPQSWGDAEHDPGVTIARDRMSATTRGKITPGESVLTHFWAFSTGDPLGHYRIRVTLPGGRVATFEFEVKDVPAPERPAPGQTTV